MTKSLIGRNGFGALKLPQYYAKMCNDDQIAAMIFGPQSIEGRIDARREHIPTFAIGRGDIPGRVVKCKNAIRVGDIDIIEGFHFPIAKMHLAQTRCMRQAPLPQLQRIGCIDCPAQV